MIEIGYMISVTHFEENIGRNTFIHKNRSEIPISWNVFFPEIITLPYLGRHIKIFSKIPGIGVDIPKAWKCIFYSRNHNSSLFGASHFIP